MATVRVEDQRFTGVGGVKVWSGDFFLINGEPYQVALTSVGNYLICMRTGNRWSDTAFADGRTAEEVKDLIGFENEKVEHIPGRHVVITVTIK